MCVHYCLCMCVFSCFRCFCFSFVASPSVLWYCWLGLLTCKNRLPYNLYCVGGDVKHCSLTHSLNPAQSINQSLRSARYKGFTVDEDSLSWLQWLPAEIVMLKSSVLHGCYYVLIVRYVLVEVVLCHRVSACVLLGRSTMHNDTQSTLCDGIHLYIRLETTLWQNCIFCITRMT